MPTCGVFSADTPVGLSSPCRPFKQRLANLGKNVACVVSVGEFYLRYTSIMTTFSTAMITGHRPTGLTDSEAAWSQIAIAKTMFNLRENYGTVDAISGMALGADTWWSVSALSAGVKLHAYVPFKDQAIKWPVKDQELWRELLKASTTKTVVGGQHYDVKMLHARNDAMLNATLAADGLVVALLKSDSFKGGTFSAVKKARNKGQKLLVLDPIERSFTKYNWE